MSLDARITELERQRDALTDHLEGLQDARRGIAPQCPMAPDYMQGWWEGEFVKMMEGPTHDRVPLPRRAD